MADHSSNHRADSPVVQDDDPFAELTRIMGHDPRRGDTSAAEIDQEGDDLALELENELLGDLANFSDSVDDASVRFGDRPVHQSSDWRFETDTDTAQVPEGDVEPSVDLAADMADELDKSFESAVRLEPAEEQSTAPEMQAQSSDWSTSPEFRIDGSAEANRSPETSADDAVFEFSEQDFAQLDAELDASISSDETEFGNGNREEEGGLISEHVLPVADPEARADDGESPVEVRSQANAEGVRAFGPSHASADPYLSPQAFASSVAKGSSDLSAGEDHGAKDDFGFAASLEEEFSAGASADEEVAEDAMEPHRDAKSDSDFSWDPFDVSTPQDATTSDAPRANTSGSIPFWREPERSASASRAAEQELPPFVDTVSVPGNERVQVEDAHHIPEFLSEPERIPDAEPDDLELALARAFGDSERLPDPVPSSGEDDVSSPMPNDAYATAALGPKAGNDDEYDFDTAFSDSFGGSEVGNERDAAATSLLNTEGRDVQFASGDSAAWEPGAFDPENDSETFSGQAGIVAPTRRSRAGSSRNRLIAGALGGVVVLGLVGFFALGGAGEDGSAPVVVRADDDPVKVKPENPGGQQVPNQDNQVYQRVSGSEAGNSPVQERLVSTAEEPVEVPKSEERLSSSAGQGAAPTSEPVTAMAPRRVRTMVVRPDGTIVPRETAQAPAANAGVARETAVSGSQTVASESQQVANIVPPETQLRGTGESVAERTANSASDAGVPQTAPVPATRPAPPPVQRQQQPATETAPTARVAAAPSQPAQPQVPAAAPVTSGGGDGWSVQISSQPTVDAAQKSYQDMARRYGSLLTGRGVNIVKADIAGKGTYYRVRIPSSSKDDAIQLCSQLKSAGGSCFVSK